MKKKISKILFATPVLGYPAVGGPKLRIENSIKALSQILVLRWVAADMGMGTEEIGE